MLTYRGFARECRRQGVVVETAIQWAAADKRTGDAYVYTRTSLLAAVAEAGRLLRKNPEVELANNSLELKRLITDDIAALTLAKILNDSQRRVPSDGMRTAIHCTRAPWVASCDAAESGFVNVFLTLCNERRLGAGSQIFINDNGEAVFIRKGGITSALSLQEITINGVRYPAGSLLSLESLPDYRFENGNYCSQPRARVPNMGVEAVPVELVASAAFMRLSAFAYPPQQRDSINKVLSRFAPAAEKEILASPLSTLAVLATHAAQESPLRPQLAGL